MGLGFPLVLNSLFSATSSSNSGSSAAFQVVFFGAIFAAMYFLLLRPQRKRARETALLQSSIGVNDEVELTSGIIGFVAAIDDEQKWVWLDIADGVEIRIRRGAIAQKITPSSESGGDTNASKNPSPKK